MANLAALDGIRVLSNTAVVLSHVVFTLGIPPGDDLWMQTMASSALLRGCFHFAFSAMDAFLILSGILAVVHLVPAMQKGPQPTTDIAMNYLQRRVLRVVPPYYATLLITWAVAAVGHAAGDNYTGHALAFRPKAKSVDTSVQTILSYLFFYQNQDPKGLLPFTWNLAAQMHFYLLLPLALLLLQPRQNGFRGRVVLLALLLLGISIAYRWQRVKATGVSMPNQDSLFAPKPNELVFYMSTIGRFSNFSMGMLIGLMALSPTAVRTVQQRWRPATAITAVAFAFLAGVALGPLLIDKPAGPVGSYMPYILWVWLLGVIHPGAVAILIAFVVSNAGPVANFASQALGSRIWKLPAKLSYNVYLMHVLALVLSGRCITALLAPPPQLFNVVAKQDIATGSTWQHWQHWQPVALVLVMWAMVQGLATLAAAALDAVLDNFMGKFQPKVKAA